MPKNYVLDTNVLLHDPNALFSFGDNTVIIPIFVIEEIDNFKKQLNELGRNARHFSRKMDELRAKGKLTTGVPLDNGGTLRVEHKCDHLPESISNTPSQDTKILGVAMYVADKSPDPTIFVSKDVNLRIRADVAGLQAEDYLAGKVQISDLYTGWKEVTVPPEAIDEFYSVGHLPMDVAGELLANQYVCLVDEGNPKHTALARQNRLQGWLEKLRPIPENGVWGIRARNMEQHFALDMLLDDSIQLVTLVGKAGTGKTLLAMAAGLKMVADDKVYERALVSRPIFPMGRDLGYLPGSIEEKLNPWMQPIFDNLELILGLTRQDRREGRSAKELIQMGFVSIEPLTYIRGRSIPRQYLVVDEAQNLTPHEMKTILTRAGEGTKIICTGDPYQIDNPYIDSDSNGLTYLVNRFKGEALAAHITLSKGERSALAELAANLL